jgi:hypothetical protein
MPDLEEKEKHLHQFFEGGGENILYSAIWDKFKLNIYLVQISIIIKTIYVRTAPSSTGTILTNLAQKKALYLMPI